MPCIDYFQETARTYCRPLKGPRAPQGAWGSMSGLGWAGCTLTRSRVAARGHVAPANVGRHPPSTNLQEPGSQPHRHRTREPRPLYIGEEGPMSALAGETPEAEEEKRHLCNSLGVLPLV